MTRESDERGAPGERWLSAIPPGLRYMAAGAFFFSLMSLFVRMAGERLPSTQIVFARALISLVLSAWMIRRAGLSFRGNRVDLLLLRGFLGFVALTCFYYSLVHLPLADATVIQYTNPVWAALLAVVILGERMRGREVLCMAFAILGVILIARPSYLVGSDAITLDPFVVGVALVASVVSAGAYVTVRKLGQTDDPLVIVFYFPLVATPLILPWVIRDGLWPTAREWALLLAVGVTTHIAQVYMTRGLRLERTGRATAVGYLQIVFAGLLGLLFLGEIPDGWFALGALLVVGSTLLLARRAPR